MYRKYRDGDLPDIQIKFSELIRPLQALAQVTLDHLHWYCSFFNIVPCEMKDSSFSQVDAVLFF